MKTWKVIAFILLELYTLRIKNDFHISIIRMFRRDVVKRLKDYSEYSKFLRDIRVDKLLCPPVEYRLYNGYLKYLKYVD